MAPVSTSPVSNIPRTAEDEQVLRRIARYEDFTTIDWVQDAQRERQRVQELHAKLDQSWRSLFIRAYEHSQAWWVILLVGLAIGVNAAFIAIATEWLSDLKLGYCQTGWWLNEKFCCWETWDTYGSCPDWRPWSTVVGLSRENLLFNWTVYVLCAGLLAVACAYLVRMYAPYAAGSGIAEIKSILSGFVIKGYMGGWTLVIKSLGLALAVSSGLSVGKEGPSVHMACCIGNVLARPFSKFRYNRAKQREVLSAASAAGVAVAFASPIGGVLFSLEELSSHFPLKTLWRSFFCALVATVSLQAFNPFRTGKLVMFQASYDKDWHLFEMIFYVMLGIFGGVFGAVVIKFNVKAAEFRKKHLQAYPLTEVAVLAVGTAIVCYLNIFLRNDMAEVMSYMLKECRESDYSGLCRVDYAPRMVWLLAMATVVRMAFTILSYGTKVPCGIFVPSMAVGATFGRMVGILVQSLHRARPHSLLFSSCPPDTQCIEPAIYAFLGAGAALGGVTKMTVSLVVIMFELTGALHYIVPTMITVMVTKIVGDFFGTGGISDQIIKLYGFPFLDKEEHLFNRPISTVMVRDPVVFTVRGMRLDQIECLLARSEIKTFPIVDSHTDRHIQGCINRAELHYAIRKAKQLHGIQENAHCYFESLGVTPVALTSSNSASSSTNPSYSSPSSIDFGAWVNYTPFTVDPRLPTETVLEMFKKLGPRIILIEHHGQLRGIVTRKDVLRALHQPTFVSKQDYFGPEDEQGLAVSEPTAPEPDMEMGTVTRRRP